MAGTTSDILRQIGSTVTDVGQAGLDKAKEWRDIARITLEIRNREFSIQRAYRELGRAYYRDHKHDDDPAYDQVEYILAAFEEIGELKTARDELRGVRRCPNCGAPIMNNANFCPNCGRPYETGDEMTEEEVEEIIGEMVDEAAEAEAEDEILDEVAEEILEEALDDTEETEEEVEESLKEEAEDIIGEAEEEIIEEGE